MTGTALWLRTCAVGTGLFVPFVAPVAACPGSACALEVLPLVFPQPGLHIAVGGEPTSFATDHGISYPAFIADAT